MQYVHTLTYSIADRVLIILPKTLSAIFQNPAFREAAVKN